MKDLEEIKEKINNVNKYSVMIGRGNSFAKGLGMIDELLRDIEEYVNQVEQPALTVIPDWFDKWCKGRTWGECMHQGNHYSKRDLSDLIEIADGENLHGLTKEQAGHIAGDFFKYLKALQDGYTVEERKYKVNVEGLIILAKACEECSIHAYNDLIEYDEAYIKELTEQEIKDYDQRYFAFAVPVEEEGL